MKIRTRKLMSLFAAGAMLATSVAVAGPGVKDAQSQYQRDRAACMSGDTHQDRQTCLREAGAAAVEAKRGGLTSTTDGSYTQNIMARCVPLPDRDQEDCVRRMRGEGTIRGSVEEGGIYRELRREVPLSQATN